MGLGFTAKKGVAAALAVGGLATPSLAEAANVYRTAADPAAVRQYWTPKRINDAIPAGALPSSAAPLGRAATSDSANRQAANRRGGTHKRVKRVHRYPFRTNGKVYFSVGLSDYQCSGTAVSSKSKSMVWTAGHCVYEQAPLLGGSYVERWAFIPAFKGPRHKPYGKWTATSLATTSQYQAGSPLGDDGSAYDVGAAIVSRRGGKTLQKAVGSRKIAFNTRAQATDYHAFGYPAESPPPEFTGNQLFRCDSALQTRDNSMNGPAPLGISCDMTGGSSGGGWINDAGKLVSVTSYGYKNRPGTLYGPYLGNDARDLFRSLGGR